MSTLSKLVSIRVEQNSGPTRELFVAEIHALHDDCNILEKAECLIRISAMTGSFIEGAKQVRLSYLFEDGDEVVGDYEVTRETGQKREFLSVFMSSLLSLHSGKDRRHA